LTVAVQTTDTRAKTLSSDCCSIKLSFSGSQIKEL